MKKLAVNVDHVATVRQARLAPEPDPVTAALLAELGGADGIIVHLREDRRHIQDRDVRILREVVSTKLNLEMSMADEIVRFAETVKPDQITLVPERRQELTTEGGLDVVKERKRVSAIAAQFAKMGILVCVFIAPHMDQIKAAADCGAGAVEIHTGSFANAKTKDECDKALYQISQGASVAANLKLKVHAGHGLTYRNVHRVAGIREIEEFSIGHSIVARAIMVGMERAVREMKDTLHHAQQRREMR